MKKILALLLTVLFAIPAYAGTCETKLMPLFTAAQATKLCVSFGSAVNSSLIPAADNTYDLGSSSFGWRSLYADTSVLTPLVIPPGALTLRLAADAQRLAIFTGTSDTDINFSWGDAGVTAGQDFTIKASTADADDDSRLNLCGGGAIGGNFGACIALSGNEDSVAGDATTTTGTAAGSSIFMKLFAANGSFQINNSSDVGMWDVDEATGKWRNLTGGGDISLAQTGTTLAIQEATASSACSGTLTLTAATPVVTNTTCATTGSRIFLTRTSIDADTTGDMAVTAITNGVSFAVTSEANDTATVNWLIVHEAA